MSNELQEVKEQLKEQGEKLEEIQQELARYKGFVGGILWVLAALFAAVKFAWPLVKDLVSAKGG